MPVCMENFQSDCSRGERTLIITTEAHISFYYITIKHLYMEGHPGSPLSQPQPVLEGFFLYIFVLLWL